MSDQPALMPTVIPVTVMPVVSVVPRVSAVPVAAAVTPAAAWLFGQIGILAMELAGSSQ
jgi:hypothetical protein